MIGKFTKKLCLLIFCSAGALSLSDKIFSTSPVQKQINQEKTAVVFDIGGILTKTNMKAAFDTLGKGKVSAYCLIDWKSPHGLRPLLYELLKELSDKENKLVCDPYGDCIPYIFYEILLGHITEEAALEKVLNLIKKNPKYFYNKREQILCHRAAEIMFDHKLLVSLQEEIKAGVQLLQECQQAGHEIFIFSNYGPQAFDELKKKFPHIFKTIPEKNIIVSAHIKAVKPHASAYDELKKRLAKAGIKRNLKTCFFIDNQRENISQSEKHGITGIYVENQKFAGARKTLFKHNILKKA